MAAQSKVFIDVEVDESVRDDAALAAKHRKKSARSTSQERDGRVESSTTTSHEWRPLPPLLEAAPAGTVHVRSSRRHRALGARRRREGPGGAASGYFTPGWATQLLLTAIVTRHRAP